MTNDLADKNHSLNNGGIQKVDCLFPTLITIFDTFFFVSKLLANFGSNLDPWKGDINSGRDWVPGVGETAILIIFCRFVRNGKNFWGPRRWMDAWVTIKYFSQSLASLMTRCCLNITLHDFFLSSNETPPALPRLSAKNLKDLRS